MKATNRRVAVRLGSVGLMMHIFDGRSAVLGIVEDFSRDGLRVSTVPASFEDTVKTCYAVVNGAWQDFHLALQPRWNASLPRGMYKVIGFQVQHPATEWAHFVETVEHGQGEGLVLAA